MNKNEKEYTTRVAKKQNVLINVDLIRHLFYVEKISKTYVHYVDYYYY